MAPAATSPDGRTSQSARPALRHRNHAVLALGRIARARHVHCTAGKVVAALRDVREPVRVHWTAGNAGGALRDVRCSSAGCHHPLKAPPR